MATDHDVLGDPDEPCGTLSYAGHRETDDNVPITGHSHNEGLWGFVRLKGGKHDGRVSLLPLDVDLWIMEDGEAYIA